MVEEEERKGLAGIIKQQVEVMKSRKPPKGMTPFYKAAESMLEPPEGPSVGYMCEFVPTELISAVGASPYRMCMGFQETTFRAEEYLPQTFCPLVKSTMGLFRDDPKFDMVVIPATCDGRRHLAELFNENVNVHIMDVPATGETIESRKLWLHEVIRLKKALESTFGKRITGKGLKQAVTQENDRRAHLEGLYGLRRGGFRLSGSDLMLVSLMSRYMTPDDWSSAVKRLIQNTSVKPGKRKKEKELRGVNEPRVLLSGSPIIIPNWKIPLLIEESGASVVVDNLCSASRTMWQPVESTGWSVQEMMFGIAERQLMSLCPCQIPFEPAWVRLNTLLEDYKIDGVIHHVLQSCHLFGVEATLMRKKMEELNIPLLSLETDYSQEDVEQLRTRIEAFIEMLVARQK